MSFMVPRLSHGSAAARCIAPAFRNDFGSLFSLFDESMRELNSFNQIARQQVRRFNPRFDLKEDKESYVLEGEVPGFQEKDLSIEWNNNVLAIHGRHHSVKESGDEPHSAATQSQAANISADTPVPNHQKSVQSQQATVEDDDQPVDSAAATNEGTSKEDHQSTTFNDSALPQAPAQPRSVTQHWISERTTGQFFRQFSFPSNAVNQEAIKASLESGILRIIVPKNAAQPTRTINIE